LISRPIRIWFFQNDDGTTLIRHVGHASEEPCALVSEALEDATRDPAVNGYATFGASELRARDASPASRAKFEAVARRLKQRLEDIADVYEDEVEVRIVPGDPDARFATPPPIPQAPKVTYAFADKIPHDAGPAFVPVRSWTNGTTRPVQFVVTAAELGLDKPLFDRLIAEWTHLNSMGRTLIRETLIDGILRGWPFEVIGSRDEAAVKSIIEKKVPLVWQRVLQELKRSGVTMSSDMVGGDLVGPSVFYRVTDRGDDSFLVAPTYIVHGSYLERWSPQRRSVVIIRQFE